MIAIPAIIMGPPLLSLLLVLFVERYRRPALTALVSLGGSLACLCAPKLAYMAGFRDELLIGFLFMIVTCWPVAAALAIISLAQFWKSFRTLL